MYSIIKRLIRTRCMLLVQLGMHTATDSPVARKRTAVTVAQVDDVPVVKLSIDALLVRENTIE